ncbi:hypothetical protein F0562_020995 [Nyssa sinensis]|uniref:Membrane protein of ER body-like protein n=1 Tax=Nyssa sinensis TaxID=561372 RepID=A0A5J5BMU2_9ASTE|nr:hypothetical protein F0562_020995 [Nyssa sinensis]
MNPEDYDLDVKLKNLDIGKILSSVINHQDAENLKGESSQDAHFKLLAKEKKENVNINLIEESEEEIIELEFERAVQKLDTHKMYCPNCNSCITKVILRRRKSTRVQPPEPIELIGCLSCFSFFPGSCFNMFSRNKEGNQNAQDAQQAPPAEENMVIKPGASFDLFRMFQFFRNKTENGNAQDAQQIAAPAAKENNENMVVKQGNDYSKQEKEHGVAASDPSYDSNKSVSHDQNGHAPSLHGTPSFGYSNGVATAESQEAEKDVRTFPPQGFIPPGEVRIDVEGKSEENSLQGAAHSTKPESEIEELKREGGDARRLVEPGLVKPVSPQQTQTLTDPARSTTIREPKVSKTLDILKSIVYGGLMESIASLSIVSSAAAADATTLNIVALGLANLIGGLFIIGNNIWELKSDYPGDTSSERNEQADRYRELLGRRENFLRHVTVAMLSFLVFGLIPPVTYAFSFRKSDDRDLKLLVVAAVSLLCIAILAFGKAHIRKPPKFYMYIKTILYYISTAIAVSGVSYVVGDLIQKLMQKLGWFESTSVAVTLSLPEMGSVNPAWGSY